MVSVLLGRAKTGNYHRLAVRLTIPCLSIGGPWGRPRCFGLWEGSTFPGLGIYIIQLLRRGWCRILPSFQFLSGRSSGALPAWECVERQFNIAERPLQFACDGTLRVVETSGGRVSCSHASPHNDSPSKRWDDLHLYESGIMPGYADQAVDLGTVGDEGVAGDERALHVGDAGGGILHYPRRAALHEAHGQYCERASELAEMDHEIRQCHRM